jgi:pimeloyl-ACP methyl ester carboxylesterase
MNQIVTANGIQMGYSERGQGEPLVLIMGLGADGSRWEDHVRVFEKHFRCILIDNRGAGTSDKPAGPYTTEMMAEDTAGLMQAIGIDRARVAGISMGAGIAQMLAIRHPHRVLSLGLISGWARCDAYMTTVFDHFVRIRACSSSADFMQLLQLWIFTAPYYQSHTTELLAGQANAGLDAMAQPAFAAQSSACVSHNSLDLLTQIKVPALITVGEKDIFTPLWCAEELHYHIPGSQLRVFSDCGHAHHWEKVDEFNRVMLEFLLEN